MSERGKIVPIAYSGEVEVEDNDFTMEFERFIIRESEIAIQGIGGDEEGVFQFGSSSFHVDFRMEPAGLAIR